MGERDNPMMGGTGAGLSRRMRDTHLTIEALTGGFVVVSQGPTYEEIPRREVVSSPEALVAVVQRWAKEATER